jgi:hypothetical protein
MPGPEYVRRVVALVHAVAGMALHTTPAHRSVTHAPLLHPIGQAASVKGYEHMPEPLHVPLERYVRTLDPLHTGVGGVLQVVPVHGFWTQAPAAQPKGQVASENEYEHEPPAHVPGELNVRSVAPSS